VVSLPYGTSDGAAIAGVDYLATSGILTLAAGETAKTFKVPILNDAVPEAPQTVNLVLGTPIGGALGEPSTAVLSITDTAPPRPSRSPSQPSPWPKAVARC
jgi:Calx-beta domain-containing protein